MNSFFNGFSCELLKLAQIPAVKPLARSRTAAGPMGMMQSQKVDPSPIASANRNTGINTPAGQPELPRGKPAQVSMNPAGYSSGVSKSQTFKASVK